jgi:hypothetical protein
MANNLRSRGGPIVLEFSFQPGFGEISAEPDHPLIAPLRLAIEQGRPPERWSWAVFGNHIVGSFAHSEGNRLLFFPSSITHLADDALGRFYRMRLDHLTLDPPSSKGQHCSHAAAFGLPPREGRGLASWIKPSAGRLPLWFSFVAPDLAGFPLVPSKLTVRFLSPRPESTEFGKQLVGPFSTAHAPVPEPIGEPSYFQFDVWAGRGQAWEWRGFRADPLSWAGVRGVVRSAPPGTLHSKVVPLNVEISATAGVHIVASRPIGEVDGHYFWRPRLSE